MRFHSQKLDDGNRIIMRSAGPLSGVGCMSVFLLSCFNSFVVDRLSFLFVGQNFLLVLDLLPLDFYPLHLPFVDLESRLWAIFRHKHKLIMATLSNSLHYTITKMFSSRPSLAPSHIKLFASWARLIQSLISVLKNAYIRPNGERPILARRCRSP